MRYECTKSFHEVFHTIRARFLSATKGKNIGVRFEGYDYNNQRWQYSPFFDAWIPSEMAMEPRWFQLTISTKNPHLDRLEIITTMAQPDNPDSTYSQSSQYTREMLLYHGEDGFFDHIVKNQLQGLVLSAYGLV